MLKNQDAHIVKLNYLEVAKQEMKKCMSQVAQVRAEHELERNISISEKVQNLEPLLEKVHQNGELLNLKNAQAIFIQEVRNKADDNVYCGCSYLVRENFEEHLSEVIDDISIKLSELIKNAQRKNNQGKS